MSEKGTSRGSCFHRSIGALLCVGILALSAWAPTAGAETSTIDFESYRDGPVRSDARAGLRYPNPVHGVCPKTAGISGCRAASGSRAIEVLDSAEFGFRSALVIETDQPATGASLMVRASFSDPARNLPSSQFYAVTARSADGAVVGRSATPLTPFASWVPLDVEVAAGTTPAVRFEVEAWSDPNETDHQHNTLVVDDFAVRRFDTETETTAPPPDTTPPRVLLADVGATERGYVTGMHLVVTDAVDLARVEGSIVDRAGSVVATSHYCAAPSCPSRTIDGPAKLEVGPDHTEGPLPATLAKGRLRWHVTACDSAGNCTTRDVTFSYKPPEAARPTSLTAWRMEVNQGAQSFIPPVTPPGSSQRFASDQFDSGMAPLTSSRHTLVRLFVSAPVATDVTSYRLRATTIGLDGSRRTRSYAPLHPTIAADTHGFGIDSPPSEAQTNVLLRRSLRSSLDYVIPEGDLEKVDELHLSIDGLLGRTEFPFALPVRLGVNLVKLYGRELGGAGAITDDQATKAMTGVQEYLGLSDVDIVSRRTYRATSNWLVGPFDGTCSGLLADLYLEFGTSDAPKQDAFAEPNVLPTVGLWQAGVGVDPEKVAGGVSVTTGCSAVGGLFPFGWINTIVAEAKPDTIAHELGHNYGQHHTSGHGEADPSGTYLKGKVRPNSYGVGIRYGTNDPVTEADVKLKVPCPETTDVAGWLDCEGDPKHRHDLMSYGEPVWTDSGRYAAIWKEMLSTWFVAAATSCPDADPRCNWPRPATVPSTDSIKRLVAAGDDHSSTVTKFPTPSQPVPTTTTSSPEPSGHAAGADLSDVTLVSSDDSGGVVKWAVVRRPDGSTTAAPMVRRPGSTDGNRREARHDPAAPLHLQVLDAGGRQLYEQPAGFATVEDGGAPAEIAFVDYPSLPGAAEVRLVDTGSGAVVASAARTAAPTVTVNAASQDDRGRYVVRWTAQDPDSDDLFSSVQASADGGRTWAGVGSTREARLVVPADELPSGNTTIRFRVSVSDGFTTAIGERSTAATSRSGGSAATSTGPAIPLGWIAAALAVVSATAMIARRRGRDR